VLYVASTNGDPGSPAVWAGWSGTFRRVDVPAAHHDMLRDPGLAITAEILDRELARLATDAPAPQPNW
jgi:thioesterase domain-containing protein